ncbi:MAG: sigma-54-dependent transcriptional regulator, partial [Planctomycetota bacterium]
MSDRSYTILIADDHESTRETVGEIVKGAGHEPVTVNNGNEALLALDEQDIDIVITDYRMPEKDGLDVLDRIRRDYQGVPVIVITAHGSEDVAVSAMKRGATDYLRKPLDITRLRAVIEGASNLRGLHIENLGLHRELDAKRALGEIIGRSPQILAMKEQILQVAPTGASILIEGDNGTGKELVANAV